MIMAMDSKYFIKFDTRTLNRDIPIEEILSRYLGVQTDGRKPIRCLDKNHIDRKPSTTVYHKTNN